MSLFKHGRYSGYLRPISYLIDLSIINGIGFLYLLPNQNPLIFSIFISIGWVLLSVYSKFYEVYRYTRPVNILSLIVKQIILFTLYVFAFSGLYHELNVYPRPIVKYTLLCFVLIAILKFTIYYLLQKYRVSFGGNYRSTVILGLNKKTLALENFFNKLAPMNESLYDHKLEGIDDMPAHIKTTLTNTNLTLSIVENSLKLGTWQGIYLFEHRLQRHLRTIFCHIIGDF